MPGPRWLSPAEAVLRRARDGVLEAALDGEVYRGVVAVRCLPVAHPAEFISLRVLRADGAERELGLVRSLDLWPAGPREYLERALARRYFVQTIRRVHEIVLEGNYLEFHVTTDLGPQRFTMRWEPASAPDHGERGRLLFDTDENRYVIPDIDALSPRERRMLSRYVYW